MADHPHRRVPKTLLALLFCLSSPILAQPGTWDDAKARHLLNRAGFGGPPAAIKRLVVMGQKAAVHQLVAGDPNLVTKACPPFTPTLFGRPPRSKFQGLTKEERKKLARNYRRADRQQAGRFRNWWFERMVKSPAPLAEKMVLFWHGHFTSSMRKVRNSYHMIVQNDLFREHALGNFRLLLQAVSRDPAMLQYLDNNKNRKGKPNENFAREVMELFTLGLGHYTEKDIKEAARAYTGWTFRGNTFVFLRRLHDNGLKTILGQTANFTGGQVLDLLLKQEAAPTYLASRLIDFFVGPKAPPSMAQRYGHLLLANKWELKPVLEALFNDPEFYSPAVMGSKIQSPVEYLVGICRRLQTCPPGGFLASTTAALGQSLLNPPNVKGWRGGEAWVTTSTLLERGNFAGYLLTGYSPRRMMMDFADDAGRGPGTKMLLSRDERRRAGKALRSLFRGMGGGRAALRWRARKELRKLPELRGVTSSEELVDAICRRFLPVSVTAEARQSLLLFVRQEARAGGRFKLPGEEILRRLVRLVLSLPEAQLE